MPAGRSLIEMLEGKLLRTVRAFLDMKEVPTSATDSAIMRQTRGEITGLVYAVAIYRNPYRAEQPPTLKAIEREFVRKAKNIADK